MTPELIPPRLPPLLQKLARATLAAFVLTFVLSRVVVLLIMTHRMPDLFLFVGQTHVHHLNYGIFLLVTVAGWCLFVPPVSLKARHRAGLEGNGRHELFVPPVSLKARHRAALIYGVGLALTFDEFGMWLHLGGGYWQRASYDAVVVVAALLALLAVVPSIKHWRRRQWAVAVAIAVACVIGLKLMGDKLEVWTPILQKLELTGPRV